MPRQARVQTSTGGYHAILSGVNKQQTFEWCAVLHRAASSERQDR